MKYNTLKRSWLLALAVLVVSLSHAAPAEADIILVGSVADSANESISQINDLIGTYNTDFTASLPTVQSLIEKLNDNTNGDLVWENNVFSNTDFKFFEQDGNAPSDRTVDIFNATVTFDESNLINSNFSTVDNPVQGFERQNQSAPSFEYYVSKSGRNMGWSLWYTDMLGTTDFNPLYTDSATGGFTRGAITDNSKAYDPVAQGGAVSHISFYSSSTFDPNEVVAPEPASLALLGLGGLLAGAGVTRRRKKLTAETE